MSPHEIQQLAEDSILAAREQRQHVRCTFGPGMVRRAGLQVNVPRCGFAGLATELIRHDLGDWRCPNGHGGTNLVFAEAQARS